MRSKKREAELEKFRQFVEAQFPGVSSHMSDTELAHLRDLVDPSARPEVALGLVRETDSLLESDDKRLEQWMTESAASGIKFGSLEEARAWLGQFRGFLTKSLIRGSSGEQGPNQQIEPK